jgi:type II secretory ATPase GspE/PulE/Tfp pilus assembly ATPase PilB-like protein
MSAANRAIAIVGKDSVAELDKLLLASFMRDVEGLSSESLRRIWEQSRQEACSFEELVTQARLVDESFLAELYSNHFLIPLFDPVDWEQLPVDPAVAGLLPIDFCRDHRLVPLADDGMTLDVAITSPDAFALREAIRELCQRQMRPLFTSLSTYRRVFHSLYPNSEPDENPSSYDFEAFAIEESQLDSDCSSARTDRYDEEISAAAYVQKLCERAIERRATDIHLEPYGAGMRVRLRLGGRLVPMAPPPVHLRIPVIAWIKKLARVSPGVDSPVQQGLIRIRDGRRRFELNVHFYPTLEGERIVMQLRGRHLYQPSLEQLGFQSGDLSQLIDTLEHGPGLVVLTGPRNAGKSTTLYACLQYLNSCERNVCSVESYVALNIPGVNQTAVHPESGWTHSRAIQELLRQDPDVIGIAELTENRTLPAALAAVKRGCLVLLVVEADGLRQCLRQLRNAGGDVEVLEASLLAVLSQRSRRRPCRECRINGVGGVLAADGLRNPLLEKQADFRCSHCRGTGYRGKFFEFELTTDRKLFRGYFPDH